MQVTKCDRCGALYEPLKSKKLTFYKTDYKSTRIDDDYETKEVFLRCSRLVMTNQNRDYDLCEKCTEEILSSFKGE